MLKIKNLGGLHMSYQSEAQLEQQLIEQLKSQNYSQVAIEDYDSLLENFKIQFELFNKNKLEEKPLSEKEWERVFNHMNGKSIFESAKILRDKFVIERDDGTKVYLMLFDEDYSKNIYQVTNQTTVVGKYTNRYDVTILINGLPLVQIELKRRGGDIKEAVNQLCVIGDIHIKGCITSFSFLLFQMGLIQSILQTVINTLCTPIPSFGQMITTSELQI